MEYVLIKNNGLGVINEKNIPNCCLFISLGTIWEKVAKEDYIFHINLFKKYLNRDVSKEEMVYAIMKVKHPEVVAKLGENQIDTIVEKFAKYSNIKISMILAENGMKWDLFTGDDKPDGIVIQHPNHFDCAVPHKYIS